MSGCPGCPGCMNGVWKWHPITDGSEYEDEDGIEASDLPGPKLWSDEINEQMDADLEPLREEFEKRAEEDDGRRAQEEQEILAKIRADKEAAYRNAPLRCADIWVEVALRVADGDFLTVGERATIDHWKRTGLLPFPFDMRRVPEPTVMDLYRENVTNVGWPK
jgi:hypothetical protein